MLCLLLTLYRWTVTYLFSTPTPVGHRLTWSAHQYQLDSDLSSQHTLTWPATRWTLSYLVSTPVPDGPVDNGLPGQHTTARWTLTYLVSYQVDSDLSGQHTTTKWTLTYLVSRPVSDGPVDRDLPGQHTSIRWTET